MPGHHDVSFEIGSLVLLYVPAVRPGLSAKLTCKWQGPYRVVEQLSRVNYVLRDLESNRSVTAHVQRMRRYRPLPHHLLSSTTASDSTYTSEMFDDLSSAQGSCGRPLSSRRVRRAPAWHNDFVMDADADDES